MATTYKQSVLYKRMDKEAKQELEQLLSTREEQDHNECAHFYVMGYCQARIEVEQFIIRSFNNARKSK